MTVSLRTLARTLIPAAALLAAPACATTPAPVETAVATPAAAPATPAQSGVNQSPVTQ